MIPVVIFVLGAGLTLLAMSLLHDLRTREEAELREIQDAVEADRMLDPGAARAPKKLRLDSSEPNEPFNGEAGETDSGNQETDLREQMPKETTNS